MDKETIEKILRELWKEDDGVYSERRIGYNMALQDVQCRIDMMTSVWHDADVMPEYKDDSLSDNQILVYGNQGGESTSVCSLVAPGIIYSPVMKEEYDWGECPFTKWAYVDDLILSINLK